MTGTQPQGGSDPLTTGIDEVLEPGGRLGFVVAGGTTVEVYQVEGGQLGDVVSFPTDGHDDRLSMFMSRVENSAWRFTSGAVLISTAGRELWRIETDTCEGHDGGGGYCNPGLNRRRFGSYAGESCEDNLAAAIEPFGLSRQSFDGDTALNLFMRTEYAPDGAWRVVAPRCGPGDRVVLRALREQVVGISNCPEDRSPGNAYRRSPLGVRTLRSGPQGNCAVDARGTERNPG